MNFVSNRSIGGEYQQRGVRHVYAAIRAGVKCLPKEFNGRVMLRDSIIQNDYCTTDLVVAASSYKIQTTAIVARYQQWYFY